MVQSANKACCCCLLLSLSPFASAIGSYPTRYYTYVHFIVLQAILHIFYSPLVCTVQGLKPLMGKSKQ